MGPLQHRINSYENPAPPRKVSRRPRTRRCLLKGCEAPFRPLRPHARYCSEVCRRKARRWSAWRARQRYRQSESGKARRQEQSRRYRQRQAILPVAEEVERAEEEKACREGHHPEEQFDFFCAALATVRVATRASFPHPAPSCNVFARGAVGDRSIAWSSGKRAGGGATVGRHEGGGDPGGRREESGNEHAPEEGRDRLTISTVLAPSSTLLRQPTGRGTGGRP
jgi:hypothetical protein